MKRIKALSFIAAMALTATVTGCGNSKGSSVSETAPVTAAAESTTAAQEEDVPEIEGYDLLWNDEFSGSELDQSKWNYEPHEPGWTNEELQEYTTSTDNVFLRDGNLVIKAISLG